MHRGCGTAHRDAEIEAESSVRGGPALFITKLMMTYAAFTRYFMRPLWIGQGTSGPDHCPLLEVERCPLLGGSKCISSIVKSIGGK